MSREDARGQDQQQEACRHDDQPSERDRPGPPVGEDLPQIAPGDHDADDEHRARPHHTAQAFHGRVDHIRNPNMKQDKRYARHQGDDIGVKDDFPEVQMPLAADDAVAVGPDQKIEGDLQRTGIKDIFASEDHVDEGQREVSDIAVDQVAAVHRVQAQRLLQQAKRRDPEEIGRDPQSERTEKSTQPLRRQIDLHRAADQAGLEYIDREPREREAVLALHHMEFNGRVADHHHDHHRHQFAHQDQSHTHQRILRFSSREIIHQAGFPVNQLLAGSWRHLLCIYDCFYYFCLLK